MTPKDRAFNDLVEIAKAVSARLHIEDREQGSAGMYDGNYICGALHPELDECIRVCEEHLAGRVTYNVFKEEQGVVKQ